MVDSASILDADKIAKGFGIDPMKSVCTIGFLLKTFDPDKVTRHQLESEKIINGNLNLPKWYHDVSKAFVDVGWVPSFDSEEFKIICKKHGISNLVYFASNGHLYKP